MKVKLCFPKDKEKRVNEIGQIEFDIKNITYAYLQSYIDSNYNCFVYLEDSGDLAIIDSSSKLNNAVQEMQSAGQSTVILLIEDLKDYEDYTNIKSCSWAKVEDDPTITADSPELSIVVTEYPKESKGVLKKCKSHMVIWQVENTSNVPLKNMNCRCLDTDVKILKFTMHELSLGQRGQVRLWFKYVDKDLMRKKNVVVELRLYNQDGDCVVQGEGFLKFEATFCADPEFLNIKSMLGCDDDLIFEALEASNNNSEMAINRLLDQGLLKPSY